MGYQMKAREKFEDQKEPGSPTKDKPSFFINKKSSDLGISTSNQINARPLKILHQNVQSLGNKKLI